MLHSELCIKIYKSKGRSLAVNPKTVHFHINDRPLWLKRPSTVAQDRPLLDEQSTLVGPFTLTTVNFDPFGLPTLDQTSYLSGCYRYFPQKNS